MIDEIRKQHPEETPEQHEKRLKFRTKHLAKKRPWIRVVILLAIMLMAGAWKAYAQTNKIDIQRIGGTQQSGANVIDTANNAMRINCITGCSGSSGLTDTQLRATPVSITGSISNSAFIVSQATGTNLHMVCDSGCSSSAGFADNATFTVGTTAINPAGGLFDDTPPTAIVAGKAAVARITANRAIHFNLRNQAGTEMGTTTNPLQVNGANGTFPVTGTFWQTTQPISGTVTVNTLPAGTNVIGHVIHDTGSTTAVTGSVAVTNANLDVALSTRTKPADQQHAIIDSGTTTVTQATGTNLHTVCDSGCGGAASDTTASGALGSLNAALQVGMAGLNSASVTLPAANNLIGTLNAESSSDGGTTWQATVIRSAASTGLWSATAAVSSTNAAYNIQVPGGASHVRVRVNPYTSGTATAGIRATTQPDSQPDPLVQGTQAAGSATIPNPLVMGGTDGTNVRAFKTLTDGTLLMSLPQQPFLNTTDFTDVTAASPTRGDIITAQGASPKWARLAVGGANTVLHGSATEPAYSVVTPSDAAGNTSGSSNFALVTGAVTNPKTEAGVRYASQFAGADAKAKIDAAVTDLGAGLGTVYIDFAGAQTWGATLTLVSGVQYIFLNNAIYDATGLTNTPFISSPIGVSNWKFLGSGGGNGGITDGSTIFKVANSSAQNINIVDGENMELGNFVVQKFTNSGGDLFNAAYMQYANIHDIWAYPKTSGAKWVNGFVLNSDANASSIYNTFSRISVLPFSGAVGAITGNCFSIIGGTGSKVTNQNILIQVVCGPHGSTAVGLNISGGSTQTNENMVFGGDFSGNATGVNLAANSARNTALTLTAENNTGTGVNIAAGNLYTKCIGCEITGNGTNFVDSGTATFWHANITGLTPLAVTPAGSILQASGTGIAMDGAALSAGAINMPSGDLLQAAGTSVMSILTTLIRAWKPLEMDEQAAPSGVGGEELLWADSTAHRLKLNNNNVGAVSVGTIVANGTSAMTTAAVAGGACGSTVTTAATNTLTTDTITFTRNAAVTAANGGLLQLNSWVTAGNVNFNYCNGGTVSNTPTAMTLNWQVTR